MNWKGVFKAGPKATVTSEEFMVQIVIKQGPQDNGDIGSEGQ